MIIPDLRVQSPYLHVKDSARDLLKLERFLYPGLTKVDAGRACEAIISGTTPPPDLTRVDLLAGVKEELEGRLNGGYSLATIRSYISQLKVFVCFAEDYQLSLSLSDLTDSYISYSESLYLRAHKKPPEIKNDTAFCSASLLSSVFSPILQLSYNERLILRVRLKSEKRAKRGVGKKAEKQNLEETFKLGRFLISFSRGLTSDLILGEMPAQIPMEAGLVEGDKLTISPYIPLPKWTQKPRAEWPRTKKYEWEVLMKDRAPKGTMVGTRRGRLFNLRIAAELHIFVAQTGMNLEQARNIQYRKIKYRSHGEDWQVTLYKARKGGEVAFHIYKSYKPHFDALRRFTKSFFPDSKYLFPIAVASGEEQGEEQTDRRYFQQRTFRNFVVENNIPWVPLSELRNTRVNWLLRRSGNEDLTAEIAQHGKRTLREKYERPSQQRAIVEVTKFWNKHDPIDKGGLTGSVIGSQCNGKPEASDDKPTSVVEPNCINPSGCLWCKHHRDVDTFDYIWSLTSMHYLKVIESTLTVTVDELPADLTLGRLKEKLNWFETSSPKRTEWVVEAKERITEGEYHPAWQPIIEFIEE